MLRTSWYQWLNGKSKGRRTQACPTGARFHRPQVERLETRSLLTACDPIGSFTPVILSQGSGDSATVQWSDSGHYLDGIHTHGTTHRSGSGYGLEVYPDLTTITVATTLSCLGTYEPAVQGPINSLDFQYYIRNFDSNTVRAGVLLHQGNNYYGAMEGVFHSQSWQPQIFSNLWPGDFTPLPGTPPGSPNFTASGAPMSLGLFTKSTYAPDVTRDQYCDPDPPPRRPRCDPPEYDVAPTGVHWGSNNFSVNFHPLAEPATHFSVVPSTLSPVAGTPFSVTVTARDAHNYRDYGYHGTVHCSSNTDPFSSEHTYTTGPGADNGVYVFSGISLRTAGPQTITCNDPSIYGFSQDLIVVPDVARTLDLAFPGSLNGNLDAGTNYAVTVTAKDQFGNNATGYTATVRFTISQDPPQDPRNVLPNPNPYRFTAADRGTKTWLVPNGVTLFRAGPAAIEVTDNSNPQLSRRTPVTVVPGVAASLLLEIPSRLTAGTPVDVAVTAFDRVGNTATGYRGTIHFTSSDERARLPGSPPGSGYYTFRDFDYGHVTFRVTAQNGLTMFTAGLQTVTVTDVDNGSLTRPVNVTVIPAPAVSFFVDAPSTATSGIPFDFRVSALDTYGNVDSNYTGRVTFASSDTDPGVVLPADYTFNPTDAGSHTFTDTGAGETTLISLGDQDLTATDPAGRLVGSVTITVDTGPLAPGRGGSDPASLGLAADGSRFFGAATIPGSFQEAPAGGEHGAAPSQVAPPDLPAATRSTVRMLPALGVERLNGFFVAVARQDQAAPFFSPRDGFVLDSDF